MHGWESQLGSLEVTLLGVREEKFLKGKVVVCFCSYNELSEVD